MTSRNIVVAEATGRWIEDRPVEIVERKGIGHPDSLCDGIAERISVEYTRWCLENVGRNLHHNFDKVQLVAGDVDVRFGHAELLKPIRIQIAGRGTPVTPDGRPIPMDVIAIEAARAHIRDTMRHLDPDRHCVIDSYAGRGSTDLTKTVQAIMANDTSFGAAHWPRSMLEAAVYETAQYLNTELIDRFPIGEDVKVMGARLGNEVILTCSVPFLALEVRDAAEYIELKGAVQQAIQSYASQIVSGTLRVDVNTADNLEEGAVYLTLTGTSAEMGDDGAVGRGNRVTGVIAPFRSASLEAASGKNPISHVGKLYNVLALLAARDIVEQVGGIREAQVYVLSQIGQPLEQPLVATANVRTENGSLPEATRAAVEEIIAHRLDNIEEVRSLLARMAVPLY